MAQTTLDTTVGTADPIRPPASEVGVIGWARANLFSSWFNSILTLVTLWLLYKTVPPMVAWLFTNATWTGDAQACRAGDGACWAFVREKWRLILFGLYPLDLQWRPALAVILLVATVGLSTWRALWSRWLIVVWAVMLPFCYILIAGGALGLSTVPNTRWGGLPLTLMLSVAGIGVAFPVGILLALGRRSELPVVRSICVAYIELIRGVPLISLLFMSSVMFPLFLPEGVSVDKLLRAQVAIIMFAAAYLAEVVRGGLQAVPKGQYEAASAMGLGYWQTTWFIVLPQALRIAIPPIVNTFIGLFKDTSLVVIIGLFDLMTAAKASLTDPTWLGFPVEAYLFIAVIYFLFCYFMSKYSQSVERYLARGHHK